MAFFMKKQLLVVLPLVMASMQAFAIDLPEGKKKEIKFVKAQPFKAPENETELHGMALYNQNCRLCHDPRLFKLKSDLRLPSAAASLAGLFEPPRSRTKPVVRQVINNGIPTIMPSFRNSFNTKELNALIAYIESL